MRDRPARLSTTEHAPLTERADLAYIAHAVVDAMTHHPELAGPAPSGRGRGMMVAVGREVITVAWWPSTFPGLAILVTVPRLRRRGNCSASRLPAGVINSSVTDA